MRWLLLVSVIAVGCGDSPTAPSPPPPDIHLVPGKQPDPGVYAWEGRPFCARYPDFGPCPSYCQQHPEICAR